jgi:Kef-type K+ transport system membrane component KefB
MDLVAHFLLAIAVILVLCHLLGALARMLGQPAVVGEIVGGLVLGPSLLGLVWPAARDWLLPAAVVGPLQLAAQLGLAAFMFLLGCDLRLDHVRRQRRAVGAVVGGAMALPFVGGLAVAVLSRDVMAGSAAGPVSLPIFFGLAVAITAMPVLARILVDLRLADTPMGSLAMASAAVGDGIAWGALTAILAVLGAGGPGSLAMRFATATGLGLFAVFVIRPLLRVLIRRQADRGTDDPARQALPIIIAGAIGFAAATQFLGLHPAIGAFLFGIVVPRHPSLTARLDEHRRGFVVTALVPLYFVGIGLNTAVGLLGSNLGHWLLLAGVLTVAMGTKFAGAALGARAAGTPPRDALVLGALMNCRGVTELVIAGIGYQYHLINSLGLTVLVLVALITTAVTSPLVRRFVPHREPLVPAYKEELKEPSS